MNRSTTLATEKTTARVHGVEEELENDLSAVLLAAASAVLDNESDSTTGENS